MPRKFLAAALTLAFAVALAVPAGCTRQPPAPSDPRGAAPEPKPDPIVPIRVPEGSGGEAPKVRLVSDPGSSVYQDFLRDADRLAQERKYTQALIFLEEARKIQDGEPLRAEIARVKGLQQAQQKALDDLHASDPLARAQDDLVARVAQPTGQQQYDAAILKAIDLILDAKYPDALVALQVAQTLADGDPSIPDNGKVAAEMQRVRDLIARQEAATRATQDIGDILKQDRPQEAGPLATEALRQVGGTDLGDQLAELKRTTDALTTAIATDRERRRTELLAEADAALREGNLRAAAIALDNALQIGEDPDRRRQLDDVRAALTRYEEQRRLAAGLRRDLSRLEDALAALTEAQKAWDTPQVRLEIDEIRFALQHRRDRLSVADFEVRGDVGLPDAGRTVSEELLPQFKARFDLVERGQISAVLGELKLEAGALGDDPVARAQVGQVARVKYLVVGSITPLNGVTAHARLVNVQTGLIEQTARLSAPTMDVLLARMPVLAQLLLMTDDQRLVFEQQLAEKAAAEEALRRRVEVKPIDIEAALPPPPPLQPQGPPPPPFGGLIVEDLRGLPPVVIVEGPPPPTVEIVIRREDPRRRRLLALSLELGDDCYRRGRYREAHRHFELALSLSDGHRDVEVRVERCRQFLPPPPPPPVVIVAPPPPVVLQPLVVINPPRLPLVVIGNPPPPPVVVVAPPPLVVVPPTPPSRPRLIVFGFLVNAEPGLVPPPLGDWAADYVSSYFGPRYDVIERGEVCWYMGRLGITMRDVLRDPAARWSLAQALNARFIVFGAIEQTGSFSVSATLLDAQSGNPTGKGAIHVQDQGELKQRMGELTAQMDGAPADQARLAQLGRESEEALKQVKALQAAGKFQEAADAGHEALRKFPDSAALRTLVQQVESQAQQAELARQRQAAAEAQKLQEERAAKERAELARQAEAARRKADAEAKARGDAETARIADEKRKAYDLLVAEGRHAETTGNFEAAVKSFQSAVAVKPGDEGFKLLAEAQTKLDAARREAAAAEAKKKEAADRAAREAAQQKVEKERAERLAAEKKARDERDLRDKLQADRLLKQAGDALAAKKYDEALTLARSADTLHTSDASKEMLTRVQFQGDEAKIAKEKAEREKAEAETKRKQDAYSAAMTAAGKAIEAKQYDAAAAEYRKAVDLYATDAAKGGLKAAEDLAARDRAAHEAEAKRKADEEKKAATVKQLLAEGQKALDAKKYEDALKALAEAGRLDPANVEVRTVKARADAGYADYLARNREKLEEERRQTEAKQWTDKAKAELAAKRYESAAAAVTEALKANPKDADATALKARIDVQIAAIKEDESRRLKEKQAHDAALQKGKELLLAKKFDEAIGSLGVALKYQADDAVARDLLKQAQDAKAAAESADRVHALLAQVRSAIAGKEYDKADKLLAEAKGLAPRDPDVSRAADELERARKAVALTPQQQKDYDLAMSAAADATGKGNHLGAVNSYKEALRIKPGDEAATKKLAVAQLSQKQVYDAELKQGQDALAAKKYDEAATRFTAALKQMPGDAVATRGLSDAKAELAKAEAEGKREADFAAALKAGRAALAAKQFDAALKAGNDALKLKPGDKEATALVQEAESAKAALLADARKREEYNRLMSAARQALVAKKYPDAEKVAAEALKLYPDDKEALALRKQAAEGAAAVSDDARKRDEAAKLVTQGRAALAGKKYDDAIKLADDALKLVAGDRDATALRNDAVAARNALLSEEKKREDFAKLLTAGKAALAAKKYDDAIKGADDALKLFPDDREAKGLREQAVALKTAEAAQAQKKQDFDRLLAAGKAAVQQKKYDDAIAHATDALKLFPGDPAATAVLKDAQAGKAGLATEAKKQDFDKLVAAGKAAVQLKKYDEAIADATEALKLFPGDAAATALLKEAQAAKAGLAAEAKKKEDFDRAIAAGKQALAAKKYDEAVAHATEALKLFPGDPTAAALSKEAQAGKATADEARKRDEFNQLLAQGQTAMTQKRYPDAVKAYTEALKLYPTDAAAQKALKAAQDAAMPKPPPPPPPADPKVEYDRQMGLGAAADKEKRYLDALGAYREALKQMPGDAKATAAAKLAEFNYHMTEGKKLHAMGKYAEAQTEFQSAVTLMPSDPDAKMYLQKAKAKMP